MLSFSLVWFKKQAFRVKMTGRAGLVYREGHKVMLIDSEMDAVGEPGYVIYTDSMTAWEPPHQSERLSGADLQRIKANITSVLGKVDWVERVRQT